MYKKNTKENPFAKQSKTVHHAEYKMQITSSRFSGNHQTPKGYYGGKFFDYPLIGFSKPS